jgi:hypothetical protein
MRGKFVLAIGLLVIGAALALATSTPVDAAGSNYVVLAWNDLGMHCYNNDFQDMAVLPPYNTLWVQVVKRGNPPKLITKGIRVFYTYANNKNSVNKTNFWDYDLALFGVDLKPNIGLKGKGLSGRMDLDGDHFIAEGIPITEFSDSNPAKPNPYQMATVTVKNMAGVILAKQQVVTPVSSEMRCDNCHNDGGSANPGISTGRVATNILTLHDDEENTSLMNVRPVLCAECHASNALGAAGVPGVPNLSKAMHSKHDGKVANTLTGCYNCHPGPDTKCLRDVMATEEGMDCVDCHGGMKKVSQNPNPWLNEPRCDGCHKKQQQNHPLYRFSTDHGGLYCAACHDSPHAIAPSRVAADGIKFQNLQGSRGPLEKCTVCHLTKPKGKGPHGED